MNKDFNLEKEFGFEELEDRLEMAQLAAADTIRCNTGDVGKEKLD